MGQSGALGTTERLHGLDAARALSMLLGVLTHGSVAYAVNRFEWPLIDPSRTLAADLFFFFGYCFRMPAFLFLSGFFARLLYTRRGPRLFVKNRLKRIVIPFVVGIVPANIAIVMLYRLGLGDAGGQTEILPLRLQHLWFLYYLTIFLAMALAVARLPSLRPPRFTSMFAPLVLAVPTGITLLGEKSFSNTLEPSPTMLAYFGLFFAVGWMFHRSEGQIAGLSTGTWQRFGLALLAFVLLIGLTLQAGRIGSAAIWGAAYARGAFAWYMTFAFTGFCLRVFAAPGRIVSYLADASYWTYLLHPPVVVLTQISIMNYAVPAIVKFAVSMAMTVAVCLVTYHLFVRSTPIGRVLSGRRMEAVT